MPSPITIEPAGFSSDTVGRKAGRKALKLLPELNTQVTKLGEPDGTRFGRIVLLHFIIYLLGMSTVIALNGHLWIQVMACLLMANQLHVLTILQHDCGHRSGFRSAATNLWVGRALAWLIFMPFTTFTEMHRRHHAYLGDVTRDPDAWFYAGGPRQVIVREWLFMPRFIYLSLTVGLTAESTRRIVRELVFTTVSYLALIAQLIFIDRIDIIAFGLLGPTLVLALIIGPLFRGAEHFTQTSQPLDAPDRYDLRFNTTSCTHPWISALLIGVNFHVEHHMYPQVPVYRLRTLHTLFADKRYHTVAWPFCSRPQAPSSTPDAPRVHP